MLSNDNDKDMIMIMIYQLVNILQSHKYTTICKSFEMLKKSLPIFFLLCILVSFITPLFKNNFNNFKIP
jgi:hypothetical protein